MRSRLIALASLLFLSCAPGLHKIKSQFFALDTVIDVTLFAPSEGEAEETISALKKECARLESLFSASMGGSEIEKINDRRDRAFAVTLPEVAELVRLSLSYSEETKGLFDITVGPLKWLWGLGRGQTPKRPGRAAIDSVLRHVDYRKVSVRGDTLYFADPETRIDLGGIAKGYALQRLAKVTEAHGIRSFMINGGGDLITGGPKPGGKEWVIGIRHPRREGETLRTITLSNACAVTSGDYERCFFENGVRYHHLFDPKTGCPSRGIISATVVCQDPVRGVVYSKVLFIKGALDASDSLPGITRYFLVDDSLNTLAFPEIH